MRAVTPGAAAARLMPSMSRGILSAVDDMDVQFRDVVEGTADRGQGGADVAVALLDLGGEVALPDGDPVGVPRSPARR